MADGTTGIAGSSGVAAGPSSITGNSTNAWLQAIFYLLCEALNTKIDPNTFLAAVPATDKNSTPQ